MFSSSRYDSSDEDNLSHLAATGILPGCEMQASIAKRPGAQPSKRQNIKRDFDAGMNRLLEDYFCELPRYENESFERRFRMPRVLFEKLFTSIHSEGIFVRRTDALNKPSIHSLQRDVAAIRIIGYVVAADALEEYMQMIEDSVMLSMKSFCGFVIEKFAAEYLREPTEKDLRLNFAINAERGFPGCIESIDCQHWEWETGPIAWAGQFKRNE